jgi:hypothetical protein
LNFSWICGVTTYGPPFSNSGEPQLLGGVVHGPLVEDAGVIDDALEAVGPVAGDTSSA